MKHKWCCKPGARIHIFGTFSKYYGHRYCANCKHKVGDIGISLNDAKFCPKCGTVFTSTSYSETWSSK